MNTDLLVVLTMVVFSIVYAFYRYNSVEQRKKQIAINIKKAEELRKIRMHQTEHNLRLLEKQKTIDNDTVVLTQSVQVNPTIIQTHSKEKLPREKKKQNVYMISWKEWIENNREMDNFRAKIATR